MCILHVINSIQLKVNINKYCKSENTIDLRSSLITLNKFIDNLNGFLICTLQTIHVFKYLEKLNFI